MSKILTSGPFFVKAIFEFFSFISVSKCEKIFKKETILSFCYQRYTITSMPLQSPQNLIRSDNTSASARLFLIHPFAGLTVLLPSIPSISSPGKCGRDADSLLSSGPRRILRMLGSPLHGSSLSGIRKSSSSARYAFRPVSSVSVRPPGPCGDSLKMPGSSAIPRPTASCWPHLFLQSRRIISGET